jgi:adenylate kinase family enzyme
MTLNQLGTRICIMGPSNSGKSTLAEAIAKARGLQVVHLDQLHHLPHTDWVPRPPAEFAALHDAAIAGDRWVMDGNYSRLLPQRLQRATGVILLDVPTTTSLYRYVRRCWFERDRRGGLEGGPTGPATAPCSTASPYPRYRSRPPRC